MMKADYKIGPAMRPPIHHDNGFLDKFSPRSPTVSDYRLHAKWIGILEAGEAGQGVPFIPHNDIPDGLAAYRHFLFGNGSDRLFSYERFVANDPSGMVVLKNAIADAQEGAMWLYWETYGSGNAHFEMTGTSIPVGGNDPRLASLFPYPQTENWQKAIGAHAIWLSAIVDVAGAEKNSQFTMVLTLHAEDRYNFNPGAKDISTGIPDSANGIFEVTGLAHQYMNYATLQRKVVWMDNVIPATTEGEKLSRGRERKPQDNRRARNRM